VIGLTRPRLQALVAGASILVGAYDQAAIGVALAALRRAWHLGAGEVALVASASAAGMVVGGLGAGLLANRVGRRRLLLLDIVLLVVASFAAALAPNVGVLVASRALGGVAVGVSYTIVFVYQRELDGRGSGVQWMAATLWAANFGMLGAYAVGALLGPSLLGARLELGLGGILALPLVVLRRRLPETFVAVPERPAPRPRWHAPRLEDVANWSAWFAYQISDQGTNVLLPIIVAELGVAQLRSASAAALAVKAVTIPASFATIWIVERLGRRRLQLAGFLGRAVCFGLLAVVVAQDDPTWLAAVLLVCGLAAGSMGPDKTTVMGAALDDDPTWRARNQGIAQTAGRLGGVAGPALFVVATSVGGPALGVGVFAASALAGALITLATRR
jgi:MFS family permease